MGNAGIASALAAAALFGASTPFAKALAGEMPAVLLAGLLYMVSGIGLIIWFAVRAVKNAGQERARLRAADLPWLCGAIAAGGIIGPVLLMTGLAVTPASTASLLLNMEAVLTALIAWFVFHENFDRRIVIGMVLIVAAGGLLSWQQAPRLGVPWGTLAIVAACLCWAIDNNLTRKVAASDAVQIAAIKGLAAGAVNLSLAALLGAHWPAWSQVLGSALIGFLGYGLSLVLFVLALRHLGAARTGAYFSTAPFVGAVISLLLLNEVPDLTFWIAAMLMAVGVWLHLSEQHEHQHIHHTMHHAHSHVHDLHHRHQHDSWNGVEPHSHPHEHPHTAHVHGHFPDIHHRHDH